MTTLQNIHWFTFVQKPSELKTLTIWQAIAYIMQNQEGLEEELERYKKDFNAIELIEAMDYLESHFNTNNPAMIVLDDRQLPLREHMNETIGLRNIFETESFYEKGFANWIRDGETDTLHFDVPDCDRGFIKDDILPYLEIQDNQVDRCLSELNKIRYDYLQDHPIADILYKALISEIDEIISNKKNSELKLAKDRLIFNKSIGYFDHEILIKTNSLKNWKTISAIENLGLLNSSINAKRKTRADLIENHLKIIGMLMNELWEMDHDYMKSKTQTSKAFVTSKLTEILLDRVQPGDSGFMKSSKLNEILGKAKKAVEDNINLNNPNSPFSS